MISEVHFENTFQTRAKPTIVFGYDLETNRNQKKAHVWTNLLSEVCSLEAEHHPQIPPGMAATHSVWPSSSMFPTGPATGWFRTVLEAGLRSASWGKHCCSIFNGCREQPASICIEHLELARSQTQNGHRDFDFQNKTPSAGRKNNQKGNK